MPKRTLGFLYERMTDEQRVKMRARLHLDPGAGHTALARLRSNIIPRGPQQIAPEMRGDDPDHRGDDGVAEGVDTVIDQSGSMTPRSRTYVSLAAHAKQINERLTAVAADRMNDEEADGAIDHLHRAEVLHHSMEGGLQAANYGDGFWRPDGKGKHVKGRAPTKEVPGGGSPEAFDAAHVARQEALREQARQAAADRVAAERARQEAAMADLRARWARDSERARQQKAAGTHDPSVGRATIGKSSRFW